MRAKSLAQAACLGLFVSVAPALAHHSFAAEYDTSKPIKVTGVGPTGAADMQTLQITVELLGRKVPLTVPTKVEMHSDDLTASGEFELTHTALGMMPFTVMLGALQVADNMKFVYRIHATAAPTPR